MPPVRAPDPPNERQRLAALAAFSILDTEPEQGFDELTDLATYICGVPISTITLVDEDREWFKSRVGFEQREGPRDWSFCAYAVAAGDVFVVPDALEDPRFEDNPYVTGEPGIRFYAGAPLITKHGEAVGTLCVIDREPRRLDPAQERALRALARQVMVQLEMRRQNETLLELDRLRDGLVAIASHELRTPLSAIQGYVEMLLDGGPGPLTDVQTEYLEIVDRNSRRLLRLAGDLLFVARQSAGKLELALEPTDLAVLVSEAAEEIRPTAEAAGIEIAVEAETVVAPVDRVRIVQLVDNLVANAVKFTPDGGRVRIAVDRVDGQAFVRVSDTGMGIPRDDVQGLFQRFARASNVAAIPGTGLGLAISAAIAAAHGGSVSVESVEGEGSTFTLRLPAADRARAGAAVTALLA